jgi:tRNA pseudouridine(55) synthase
MRYLHKEAGLTMKQFIDNNKFDNKICFCGRLDPLARGKILILEGSECKNVKEFLNTNKTYQFEIIIGIQTKSDDPLGIIENIDINYTNDIIFNLKQLLSNYKLGLFEQKFHNYSSKTINGKPLWEYTKNNINFDNPTHKVNLYSLEIRKNKKYNFNTWRDKIINQIDSIDKNKDFDQKNIIKQWKELNIDDLISIPVEINVSSGFYVRQFVRDLSEKINYPLLTFDINRINLFK